MTLLTLPTLTGDKGGALGECRALKKCSLAAPEASEDDVNGNSVCLHFRLVLSVALKCISSK